MPIKINIALSSGGRFKPVASRTLADRLITVGRDTDCTLTLEDAQKHVSRVHAELEEEGSSYWMKVVSKVNPVIVNGKRYMYGNRVALAEGDTLAIGLYRLEILKPEVPVKAAPADVDPDLTYVRPLKPPEAQPAQTVSAAQEEEATFVPPPKSPPPPPPRTVLPEKITSAEDATYIPSAKGGFPGMPPPAARPPLPDLPAEDEEATFIPQAPARPAPGDLVVQQVAQFRRPPESTTPVSESKADATADLDFDLSEEETYVPRPADAATPVPRQEVAPPAPVDLSEERTFIRPSTGPAPVIPPAFDEGEFSDEMTMIRRPGPPAPVAPAVPAQQEEEEFSDDKTMIRRPAPPAPAKPAASAPAPGASGDPILHAFLEGAGLSHLAISNPQAFMRDSGVLVRAAIEGLMMLLLAREEARKELGAGASEPEGGDNPLKSMASPAEVITFLFDPKRPAIGDSDPVQALGDACGDLRAHQVALLAAMKAAVAGALNSVDPRKIEREHGTSLGGLNLTRKSKLWDISIAQHEKLAREVEEDFGATFGREILAAYTAQVRKARGGR